MEIFTWNFQDKTFGLKNKKGAKNQKFIAQVENQVKNAGKSAREVCNLNLYIISIYNNL
jgi:hypothetical protein